VNLLLLALFTILISGCAGIDNSMAGNGVDIPDEKPLSAQPPVLSGTAQD
jgi:hypothetical protein